MPLSWNEIKTRAAVFVNEWEDESREEAEAKAFWDQFFNAFGVLRRKLCQEGRPAHSPVGPSSGRLWPWAR